MAAMPTVFLGHGNPMNALAENGYTQGWADLGADIPRPKAILSVSAHWYVDESAVTSMRNPRTIHDFGGFPRELFDFEYLAPGDPGLAERVAALLDPLPVRHDEEWGLDHGTWAVLCHIYPEANVPVVQLSIDAARPARFHFDLGRRLRPLRDEGILVVGSGNIVHNLRLYSWDGRQKEPYPWAQRFDTQVRDLLMAGEDQALIDYEMLGPDARLSIPTPDHFLPLLYVLGLRRPGETASFPVEGFDGGSMSMRAVRIG